MNGIFLKNKDKKISAVIFLAIGCYFCIRFGIFGVSAIVDRQISSLLFCLMFVLMGAFFAFVGICILTFNRNAFFTVRGGIINGRYGLNKKLRISIDEIIYVDTIVNTLKLYTHNGVINISGLNNAQELCNYIAAQIIMPDFSQNKEKALKKYGNYKKERKKYLITTVALLAILFINIIVCVLLTGGRDISEFAGADKIVFIVFAILETITLALAFFFAVKSVKKNEIIDYYKRVIESCEE